MFKNIIHSLPNFTSMPPLPLMRACAHKWTKILLHEQRHFALAFAPPVGLLKGANERAE